MDEIELKQKIELNQEIETLTKQRNVMNRAIAANKKLVDTIEKEGQKKLEQEKQDKYELFLQSLIGATIQKIEIEDVGYANSGYDSSHGTWVVTTDKGVVVFDTYPPFQEGGVGKYSIPKKRTY